jgi:sn-glycerol 3-phosphate transport system substrate-binding protein
MNHEPDSNSSSNAFKGDILVVDGNLPNLHTEIASLSHARLGRSLLALIVLLTLSACASATTTPTATMAPEPTTRPEPVTITFWYSIGSNAGEVFQGMVDEFNAANPYEIIVEASYSGTYPETAQKVIDGLENGDLPNGGVIPAGPLWTCHEGNYQIKEYINGPEGLDVADFWPVLWDYNSYGGDICSLPFNNSTAVLYYNKDLMAAAGLDPEAPPATWDELYARASQIVASGDGVWGVDTSSPGWWFKALILQNGGQIMNEDASAPAFASPAGYGALEFWKRLVDDGLMPVAQHEESRNLFMTGQLGFLISSTGYIGTVKAGAQFDWGTAFLPKQNKHGATVGGAALVMFPSDLAHEQATWRFLKWLASPANSVSWTIATGYVPTRLSALGSDAIQQLLVDEPVYRAGFEQLSVASTYPHFWEMGDLDVLLHEAIEQVELGAATPQAALDQAAALLVEEMGD